jgi:Xaa-Pro dipeptidase
LAEGPSDETFEAHRGCLEIGKRLAARLKPDAVPSELYNNTMNELDENFRRNFMGLGERSARFLGHGVGLQMDEFPVIASGYEEPLVKNMVISLEPKKGIAGVGLAGVEETYIVTENGGNCITGGGCDIISL